MRILCSLLAVAVGISAWAPVRAATYCVSTTAELTAALTSAAKDTDDTKIKLVAGTYQLAAPIDFSANQSLRVEGGFAAGCTGKTFAYADTTLRGASGISVRLIAYGGGLYVGDLVMTAMSPPVGKSAIQIGAVPRRAQMERVTVKGNSVTGVNDAIVQVFGGFGAMIDNNVIVENANAYAALDVAAQYANDDIYLANNTIANNGSPGVQLDAYSENIVALYNNILTGNRGDDLSIGSPQILRAVALNNTWGTCSTCDQLSDISQDNDNAPPGFNSDYSIGPSSAMVDKGFNVGSLIPDVDMRQLPRVNGGKIDKGAFESSASSLTVFTVTSTADSGPGSLRTAFVTANSQAAPMLIRFNLPIVNCPAQINLLTPLPPLVNTVIIDGTSQPGSFVNNLGAASDGSLPNNANMCVEIKASGSVSSAINVPSTALSQAHVDVSGIAFDGFASAINIGGGNGSWIHGNRFVVDGFLTATGNGVGVSVTGGTASTIGGDRPADVNIFGAMTGAAAIRIASGTAFSPNTFLHRVVQNSIGAAPNPSQEFGYGNAGDGIRVAASARVRISQNYIIDTAGAGVTLDGAQYATLFRNRIGDISHGNGTGVLVTNNADNNQIGIAIDTGYPIDSAAPNSVVANSGVGIRIDSTAGKSNNIGNNEIYANTGLAIDMGDLGPVPSGLEAAHPDSLNTYDIAAASVNAAGDVLFRGVISGLVANDRREVVLYLSTNCADLTLPISSLSAFADATGTADDTFVARNVGAVQGLYLRAVSSLGVAGRALSSEGGIGKRILGPDSVFQDSFEGITACH